MMNIKDVKVKVKVKINDEFIAGFKVGLSIAQQLTAGKEFDNNSVDELVKVIIKNIEIESE